MSEEKINFVHCNIDNNFDKWQAGILKELESRIKELESSRRILSTFVDDNTRNFTKQHCEIVDLKKQIMELKKDFDDLVNKLQTTFVGIDIASGKDKTVFSVVKPGSREPGLYVKSKNEIIKWLKANGYKRLDNGFVDSNCKNWGFHDDMFDYCGKKINVKKNSEKLFEDEKYIWLPEWLEEVPGFINEAAPVSQDVWDSLSKAGERGKKSGEKLRENIGLKPVDKSQETITNDDDPKEMLKKIKDICLSSQCGIICVFTEICKKSWWDSPCNWDI